MNSHENTGAAPLRLNSVLFAVLAMLPLGGCASWNKPALSVKETSPPALLGANHIDPAMRERILRAVGQDSQERALQNLKQHPDNVDAAISLTKALLAQKREHEALQVLDEVLAADPSNLRALNAKGVVLDIQGRHAAAQALYRRALKTEPENQMLQHNLNLSLAFGVKSEPSALVQSR
ncbi:hypothetical protein ILFOPFJJ_06495 [Ensifer psoraleae]|uniref:tetratricopeptide repeat protein n=1 Tax=Sinorhizobium psoraleae TaxID=520838 RepID=UPI001568127F|nr:tetratricopeptide repeat protein [Sinorhizobium psoraleae]NRP75572.1 hypothetical protein [Sinorhizobium psoraleae]